MTPRASIVGVVWVNIESHPDSDHPTDDDTNCDSEDNSTAESTTPTQSTDASEDLSDDAYATYYAIPNSEVCDESITIDGTEVDELVAENPEYGVVSGQLVYRSANQATEMFETADIATDNVDELSVPASDRTLDETKVLFRDIFGKPTQRDLNEEMQQDEELLSMDGTTLWLPDSATSLAGLEHDDFVTADQWEFDTAQYGKKLRERDDLRNIYVLMVDGGETWYAVDSERVELIAKFEGTTTPRLLEAAEIPQNTDDDTPPIRFGLTVGQILLTPLEITEDKLSVV